MDVREQRRFSGLVLGSNPEEPAEWTRNDQNWPPLELSVHASVVVNPPNNINEQIVVVVGGEKLGEPANNSVLLFFNAAEQSTRYRLWIEGPAMNEARSFHAAVVCNGSVYTIGGHNYRRFCLNTIERIDIIDLLSAKKHGNKKPWETLTCR